MLISIISRFRSGPHPAASRLSYNLDPARNPAEQKLQLDDPSLAQRASLLGLGARARSRNDDFQRPSRFGLDECLRHASAGDCVPARSSRTTFAWGSGVNRRRFLPQCASSGAQTPLGIGPNSGAHFSHLDSVQVDGDEHDGMDNTLSRPRAIPARLMENRLTRVWPRARKTRGELAKSNDSTP